MKIYDGELEFNEAKHHYTFNKRPVPGVTTILQCINKPALVQWSAGMASAHWAQEINSGRTDYSTIHMEARVAHRKKAQAAADIGTEVHAYAEAWFKKQDLPKISTKEAQRGVDAFHKWVDSHKIEIVASERRVFSKKYHYAGTTDFIAKIDGVLGVGDIKTSSGIYPEMRLQTAAYQHALQEEKDIEFPVRWIVRFDKKTGEFEAKSFHNFKLDFEAFLSTLNLHRCLQEINNEGK